METIREILKRRDGASDSECDEMLDEARNRVEEGDDPEKVCAEEFGLEPDYVFDDEFLGAL